MLKSCSVSPHISSLHLHKPLTWKRTSWLIRWLPSSLPGFDTTDRCFFSAMARSLMNSSRLGRPSCWDSSDWSWARSMEPNRIMDSGNTGKGRKKKRWRQEIKRNGGKWKKMKNRKGERWEEGRGQKKETEDATNVNFGERVMSRLQETPCSCCSSAEGSAQLYNKRSDCSECVLSNFSLSLSPLPPLCKRGWQLALSNCLCYSTCWLCIWLNAAANCSCVAV